MFLADTLSRAFPTTEVEEEEQDTIHNLELAVSDKQLHDIQKATAEDDGLKAVIQYINTGWPDHVPIHAQPYFAIRHELSLQDGIVLKSDKVVVPKSARAQIRTELHSAHLGLESTLRRARESVYWPGMATELKDTIARCEPCNIYSRQQPKEPLKSYEIPDRPWERIAIDFFTVDGKDYMVTVDYYSDFFELDHMSSKDAPAVIKRLKRHFARHGVPLHSDNGPPFNSSAFAEFATEYTFTTVTSSPEYPQSNG